MSIKGLWGRVIRIDLNENKATVENIDEADARAFVGGKGLAAAYAFREIPKGADALGPENRLYIMTGPLTGTPAPTGNRTVVATRSPLTGTFTDSYCGGFFGPELKFAGYDGIILEGASRSPVRIHINDDDIRFFDAASLWGMDTWAVSAAIKGEHESGGKKVRVMSIGPAGERRDLGAAVIADGRAAARGGVGAVMGSKRVKAISISGSMRPLLADNDRLLSLVRDQNKRLNENPATADGLRNRGTVDILMTVNETGALPTKNFQYGQSEDAENVSGGALQRELWNDGKNRHPCWNCVIKCAHFHVLDQQGYEGKIDEGPEYETVAMLGVNCGIHDPKAISLADHLLDGYGLDTISTGNTIAFLMECFEEGLLGRGMTDGYGLQFGNKDAWLAAISAAGEGKSVLGRLVANGVRQASQEIGMGSEFFAAHVKGQAIPGYDPRCGQGVALAYARGCRGADHTKPWMFGIEYASRIAGDPFDAPDRPALVKSEDERSALLDCTGACRFVARELNIENDILQLLNAVTGFDYSLADLLAAGERAVNIARGFNAREGFSKKDDALPGRFTETMLRSGLAKGGIVNIDSALAEYYALCGWNEEGVPTREKLLSLGLKFVYDALYGSSGLAGQARASL